MFGAVNAGNCPPLSTGICPDAVFSCLRDTARMSETFIDRVDSRIRELGTTDRAVSLMVTEEKNPDLIRDLRRRPNARPRDPIVLDRLAEALETTRAFLLYGRTDGDVVADKRTGYNPGPAGKPFNFPKSLPVFGTAIGADLNFEGERDPIETHIVELTEEIDWIGRPPAFEGRRDVYALYISGSSMEPRHEPGDPVIVDPKRPPSPGDDVIVQIRAEGSDEVKAALIKRLVRRTARHIELRQYNPSLTFTVNIDRVHSIHRVIPWRDVLR